MGVSNITAGKIREANECFQVQSAPVSQIFHQHKQKLALSPDQNKHFKMLLLRWYHVSSVPELKEELGRELD